jgi:hypothetical protein
MPVADWPCHPHLWLCTAPKTVILPTTPKNSYYSQHRVVVCSRCSSAAVPNHILRRTRFPHYQGRPFACRNPAVRLSASRTSHFDLPEATRGLQIPPDTLPIPLLLLYNDGWCCQLCPTLQLYVCRTKIRPARPPQTHTSGPGRQTLYLQPPAFGGPSPSHLDPRRLPDLPQAPALAALPQGAVRSGYGSRSVKAARSVKTPYHQHRPTRPPSIEPFRHVERQLRRVDLRRQQVQARIRKGQAAEFPECQAYSSWHSILPCLCQDKKIQ